MHTKDYLIAFTGALANLPDLVEVGQHLERASPAVRQRSASAGSAGSSTDSGSQTTAVLADLCDKHGIDEEGGLLLLSELQVRRPLVCGSYLCDPQSGHFFYTCWGFCCNLLA